MITWMQKHKKWLIVTIWISTIAFVGAGFVGWGSYNYNKSDSAVAVVGKKEVSLNDLQSEYSSLYSQYQNMFGKAFNKELAKQLNLENIALQKVIQKYLILNYADDLGLITTDREVAKELVKIKSFLKDGKFNKNQYMQVLKQNRTTIAQFETQLKQDLLVQKVQNLFDIKLFKNEINNIGQLLYSEDKISIQIVKTNKIVAKVTSEDIKQFWEKTKEQYKTSNGYQISFKKIDNIDGKTKKQMRKSALKLYVKAKKDSALLVSTKTIYADSSYFEKDFMTKLNTTNSNSLLKPVYKDGNYYVVKLINKVEPKTLAYKEVKNSVKIKLQDIKTEELLSQKIKKDLKNFKGKNIGYISRDNQKVISKLSKSESDKLLQKVFSSSEKISYVKFDDKIVLFEITDTKLSSIGKIDTNTVEYTVQKMKTQIALNRLLKQLETTYSVQSFMKE